MAARGELFTTQIILDNRTYFFNVKENRTGDVFLQIVESKSKNGEVFDRHQVAIFAENMRDFLQGFEKSLAFIEKNRKENKTKPIKKTVYRNKKNNDGKKEQSYREQPEERNVDITIKKVRIASKRKNTDT